MISVDHWFLQTSFLMSVQLDFSVLSWNVRGAANVMSKRHVKEMVKKHNPEICFILETHVQFCRLQNFWLKLGYSQVGIEEAHGHAGGIWALARNDVRNSLSVLYSHPQAITVRVTSGSLHWVCSGVYASPIPVNRHLLWDHLRVVANGMQEPWVLLGDFNDISVSSEQRGGLFSPSRARMFVDNFDSCGLMDIGAAGMHYTWFRSSVGRPPIHKRLDRALSSLLWRTTFPEGGLEVLPRLHSDHSPILLRCGSKVESRGQRPFRFEAAWTLHPRYKNVVSTAWDKGRPRVLEALHEVRNDSLEFNRTIFGNIFRRKMHIENCIASVQLKLETVDSVALLLQLDKLKKDLDDTLAQEEML